ncbi:hypothetical protein GCM10027347_38160 [Larkinella harenae]
MSPDRAAGWLQAIENTTLAVAIRQSTWLYPGLEIVHIIGIVLLVGGAFVFDFRLLGLSPFIPVTNLATHVLPWSQRGLLLVVPSGLLLFCTNAEALGNDPMFWLKLLLIAVAGVNVLIFHRITFRSTASWNDGNIPIGAKTAAIVSIVAWLATIGCGRLLAY